MYPMTLIFSIFGMSDFTARLSTVIFGTLTVPLCYIVGSKLYDSRETGLFSALFVSFLKLHVNFSRGATLDILLIFIYILIFYFVNKSIQNSFYLIHTAVFLALSIWIKYTSFFVLLIILIYILLVDPKKLATKNFIIAISLFILICVPLFIGLAEVNFFPIEWHLNHHEGSKENHFLIFLWNLVEFYHIFLFIGILSIFITFKNHRDLDLFYLVCSFFHI